MDAQLKQIQKKETEILVELDRICKKHGIPYWIGQGTLLGAAKYQGFIPWDDDVDVLMTDRALEQLLAVFPAEADSSYLITNHQIERYYPLPWTKIRARDTLSRPRQYRDLPIHWGISIDLFPVYPLSDSGFLRKIELFELKIGYKLLFSKMTRYEAHRTFLNRCLEVLPIWLKHGFVNLLRRQLTAHGEQTAYVFVSAKGGRMLPREMLFGSPQTLPFEGREYPVPAQYDAYLTEMYGDYRAPLPEAQQHGHEERLGEIEWKV